MKKITTVFLLLVMSIYAQDNKNWDILKFEQNSLYSVIPYSLHTLDSINLGNSYLNYNYSDQKIKDAFSPSNTEGFKLDSERFVEVKDWKFYGHFEFSKYEQKKTGLTSMANPYRDNPYQIADSLQADWRKQHYLIQTKVLSPTFFNKFKSGINLTYEILNGARQRDPRPLDKTVDLQVKPFLLFNLTDKIDLGVAAEYKHYRQDLSISNQNIQQAKNLYKLLGLGEYKYNMPVLVDVAMERSYKGNTYGSSLFMAYKTNDSDILQLGLTYNQHKEDVTDGNSTPSKAGQYNFKSYLFEANYLFHNINTKHNIEFSYLNKHDKNIEYFEFLDNVTQQYNTLYSAQMHDSKHNKVYLKYKGIYIPTDNIPSLLWNIGGSVTDTDQKYFVTDGKQKITTLNIDWSLQHWVYFKKHNISFKYSGMFQENLKKDLNYTPNQVTTDYVANNILYPNYEFNTLNWLSNQFDIQFTFSKFKKREAQLYIKGSYQIANNLNTSGFYTSKKANQYFGVTLGLYN